MSTKAGELQFGRIDILVNNAGQGLCAPVESIDLGDYRAVMELNVFAVLSAMQAVIPIMRQQGGGMILNVSSVVSKNYFTTIGGYASTKYALNALSLTARQELAKGNIVVSVFHPKNDGDRIRPELAWRKIFFERGASRHDGRYGGSRRRADRWDIRSAHPRDYGSFAGSAP